MRGLIDGSSSLEMKILIVMIIFALVGIEIGVLCGFWEQYSNLGPSEPSLERLEDGLGGSDSNHDRVSDGYRAIAEE